MAGYNHYPWCDCGWCVKDRGYKYEDNGNSSDFLKVETYESFTIPNVRCKCCGNEIYFYQSPYGGKVFFNELGHPWEKHCCEKKCCAKEKETIPYDRLEVGTITRTKPSWEKDGWIPAIFIRKEVYDSYLIKIILKSMFDNKEYSFFIQKVSFLDIEESFAVNFKILEKSFYEISFYSDRTYKFIANKEPNFNDLKEFLDIKNSLKLVKKNNIKNIKLAEIFFKLLNGFNNYKNEKEQIYQLIFNHKSLIKSDMLKVYSCIHRQGLKGFEENLFNNFELYDSLTLYILLIISKQQTLLLNRVQEIILDKWKKKGWIPYYYKTHKRCDTWVEKIVLIPVKGNENSSYFIQKKYFNSALKEGIIVLIKSINKKFFEMSYYDSDLSKECNVIIGKYPSNYELDTFIFIQDSLKLIQTDNIGSIKLVETFFKILNISDEYENEKEQLFNFIINHESSKQLGMFDIYQYINKFGLKKFEENFLNKLECYDSKVINILFSINGVAFLTNLRKKAFQKQKKIKITTKKKNYKKYEYSSSINQNSKKSIQYKNTSENKTNLQKHKIKTKKSHPIYINNEQENIIVLTSDYKTNLRKNRKEWKGISIYKSKKELIFMEKETNKERKNI